MRRFAIVVTVSLTLSGVLAYAHVDDPTLPEGCGSCHVGHGMKKEPMLSAAEEEMCYHCHGSQESQAAMRQAGRLAEYAAPVNIEREFEKMYRHPVKEGTGHSATERLPGITGTAVNHAECVDCHNPHQRFQRSEVPTYEVQGYSLAGQYVDRTDFEYEICLKCHSVGLDIDRTSKNMLQQFSVTVLSQHPVTKRDLGPGSVSLSSELSPDARMKCSDCHTNDNPDGPRGPHGSRYPALLSANYELDPYTDESPFAFEFCYSCHDRSSILGNESFPRHREHIVGNPLNGVRGTSCYTCHASHSSRSYEFLIDFNREAVSPSLTDGRIEFVSFGNRSGACYLKCHGYSHDPAEY
jgi:predicted CXXCH cytochrome family protein